MQSPGTTGPRQPRPWVLCPLCDRQQPRPPDEICPACGAELRAEPDLAPLAAAVAAAAAADDDDDDHDDEGLAAAPGGPSLARPTVRGRPGARQRPEGADPGARQRSDGADPGARQRPDGALAAPRRVERVAVGRGPAAQPPTPAAPRRPLPAPPVAGGGIFDLAVQPEDEERDRRKRGVELERRLLERVAAPAQERARERRSPGEALAAAGRAFGRGLGSLVRALPRPGDIPTWARVELLVGLLCGLLVLTAFWLDEGEQVGGTWRDGALGLTITLPEAGWFRYPLDVEGGKAVAFRSAAVPADATTFLWVLRRPVRAQSPYRRAAPPGSDRHPAGPQPLDAAMLVLDAPALLTEVLAATDVALSVRENRGCSKSRVGAWAVARCRYLAAAEATPYELDLVTFGDERGLVIVLLANRAPVTAADFAAAWDVVESIRVTPE